MFRQTLPLLLTLPLLFACEQKAQRSARGHRIQLFECYSLDQLRHPAR